jgi:hypothetical protein
MTFLPSWELMVSDTVMMDDEPPEHAATRHLTDELTKRDVKLAESRQEVGCGNCAICDISAISAREIAQAYLGHRNIQHTVRYTELSPDALQEAVA